MVTTVIVHRCFSQNSRCISLLLTGRDRVHSLLQAQKQRTFVSFTNPIKASTTYDMDSRNPVFARTVQQASEYTIEEPESSMILTLQCQRMSTLVHGVDRTRHHAYSVGMNTHELRPVRRPDDLDETILELLHSDGRMSYSDIARNAGCNEVTAKKRVERLVSEGTLAVIGISNPSHLGFQTQVWIGLDVELNKLDEVAEKLAQMPELSYVACSAGEYDIIATAAFESNAHLYEFLVNSLGNVEGIQGTHTSHLIRLMRRTFAFRKTDPVSSHKEVQQRPILMPRDPLQQSQEANTSPADGNDDPTVDE
jgi:Lrp/AsnC family transcriptional regulator, regulator for asnA, asnC and gidA